MRWTPERHGMQYRGVVDNKKTRVSVRRTGEKAILLAWYPGCGFSPKETTHASVEEAKEHGDSIMEKGE